MAGMTEQQWADVVNFGSDEPATPPAPINAIILPLPRPEDFTPGARVKEIYADTTGTVKARVGVYVEVVWDVPQPEDALIPHPTYDELVRLG